MPDEQELRNQLTKLCAELDKRGQTHRVLDAYREGNCPLPRAIVRAKVTKAYRMLMPMASSNWGGLVVDSVQDRLEVAGIRADDDGVADAVWGVWQDNQMDSESKLAHDSALTDGRAFALVWPNPRTGEVEISLDDSSQMIVQYRAGSRRERVAALRRWIDDDDRPYATLYRPDGIYKFIGPKNASGCGGTQWQRRDVPDETWPLANPLGEVTAVELAVNRRLKAGTWGYARGEFQSSVGHIDRINILTFLGLVVAFWMGFPLRGVIGDALKTDDNGDLVPPFEAMADTVFQIENPKAQLAEFAAADLKNLSVLEHVEQLATITKTPRHYFPLGGGMSNLSADAIRASEAALNAKVTGHKGSLSEGWEEVLRLAGRMLPEPVELSKRAELLWKDHESRSMAERADAAVKLKDILPWQALAEMVLNATQDQIVRWESMRASDAFAQLLAGAGGPALASGAPAEATIEPDAEPAVG